MGAAPPNRTGPCRSRSKIVAGGTMDRPASQEGIQRVHLSRASQKSNAMFESLDSRIAYEHDTSAGTREHVPGEKRAGWQNSQSRTEHMAPPSPSVRVSELPGAPPTQPPHPRAAIQRSSP